MSAPIEELALCFPSLQGAAGVQPWDPNQLDAWACDGASHAQRVTIQLLLAVWNLETTWDCGRFDLMEGLALWDLPHRVAFLHWAKDPWWP
jgi:hypothetical protein